MADEIAKKAAHDLANEIDVTDSVRLLDQPTLWKIIREEQIRAWQLSWTRSSTGTATREILPSVRKKIFWSGSRSADISYARLLLNSTNLNDDRYRMKFSETPNCECGKDRESADHFLIHCEEHREARQIMFDAIMNVWMEKKSKGSLNVSRYSRYFFSRYSRYFS